MYAVAFFAGSWPPSPGLLPWAILISSWSARARYWAVTPKRADATCLIRASWRSPVAVGVYQAGILAALAGVRGAAGALDADRQRLVGLRRERADRHRRHDEAADDVAGGLDVGEVDGGRRRRRGGFAARRGRPTPGPASADR